MPRQVSDKEAMHLYQLIGAPLLAVVEAEVQAAQASAEFIRRVGFEKIGKRDVLRQGGPALLPSSSSQTENKDNSAATATSPSEETSLLQDGGNVGGLKMLRFGHSALDRDGRMQNYETYIPVLSLFPLPLLQIKSSEFDFGVRIIEHVAEAEHGSSTSANPEATQKTAPESDGDFLSPNRVRMKAALASSGRRSDRTSDMQMKIKVRMEQADIPAGLAKLLNLMDRSIQSIPKDKSA